jgi:DNA repair protein RecO (recombination protein O)
MPAFSTPAILLRRLDYGDYDLIITFFSLTNGKISLIAKAAKKSSKRFAGVLELFSVLNLVGTTGRGKGLPILQEAAIKQPFSKIRANIQKTAYASYWVEIIYAWMAEYERQTEVYYLLKHVLSTLDSGAATAEALSILFQMRFLAFSGHHPNLHCCSHCRTSLEMINQNRFDFDIVKGGITCNKCTSAAAGGVRLAKGTVKQLLWVASGDLFKAARMKFTSGAIREGLEFLEAFVPYHLGKQPRSLKFLRQIRDQ